MTHKKFSKKKKIALILSSVSISLFSIGTALAQMPVQESPPLTIQGILRGISSQVTAILNDINQLPTYIQGLSQMATSWNDTIDTTNISGYNQMAFGLLNQANTANAQAQLTLSTSMIQNYLQAGDSTNTVQPSQNEYSYLILRGADVSQVNESPAQLQKNLLAYQQKYIMHAAGSDLYPTPPNPQWSTSTAVTQYQAIYGDMSAIASFNAFILGKLYQKQDPSVYTTFLTNLATSSDWFQQVGSEHLGLVLRHLLLYTSQIYVKLDNITRIQELQLTAQAMSNTLALIQIQQGVGQIAYNKAQQGQH